ncbi:hypothetical protein [Acetobacter oeni]|uniref:Cysteine-rich CWC n=1 Tax=Acetobacter oeni TaxID=304077 RepID=A0A511XG68_9PROT|nr:hypothetical protein [Acetobacter oeni]MBB3882135.1 hypothetical protein [Acetobacter oeni]NHO17898.1 hypothetical protein [Acetobacter oeni]GBR01552.1 hypothetical protein AA21952_0462 [Acetobacter oeni LMG 21952]GEN61942.1 hypothetical protein AOE01nite_01660 [Acetobacter oeni]
MLGVSHCAVTGPESITQCSACGAEMSCMGTTGCWCMTRERALPVTEAGVSGCLCPPCLDRAIARLKISRHEKAKSQDR